MANKQIKQLNEQTTLADADLFVIQDGSTDETKKLLASTIQTYHKDNFWWEELGRTTLGSASDTISLASFSARKYLQIYFNIINSGTINTEMTFNGDTGTNYSWIFSTNVGAGTSSTSQTAIPTESSTATSPTFGTFNIVNVSSREKMCWGNTITQGTAGGGNAPVSGLTIAAKWANTSAQITTITLTQISTGDFASGSELIVLGHD